MNALYLSGSKLHFPLASSFNKTVIATAQDKRNKKNKEPILEHCNILPILVLMTSLLHMVYYIASREKGPFCG